MSLFEKRHIGVSEKEQKEMLAFLGFDSLDELIKKAIPSSLLNQSSFKDFEALSEQDCLKKMNLLAKKNKVFKTYIGQGYHDCHTPTVILRNILENPAWYTSYTPYQAEISQGRLESLLNFQTLISELTGMDLANASLLDESSACFEAIFMAYQSQRRKKDLFYVCNQTLEANKDLIQKKAQFLKLKIDISCPSSWQLDEKTAGIVLSYPQADGEIFDFKTIIQKAKDLKIPVIFTSDLLSLSLLESPKNLGADIVVGSSQRFGVPLGFGGPYAAFISCNESFKRLLPGRIVGVSKDVHGKAALRLALQTREQHIRREKATSNICTAQALLANIAAMYALYHGKKGLIQIAKKIQELTGLLYAHLEKNSFKIKNKNFFDTITLELDEKKIDKLISKALKRKINLGFKNKNFLSISLNEVCTLEDIKEILEVFEISFEKNLKAKNSHYLPRKDDFLKQKVFHEFQSETNLLRYIHRLEKKDISLTHSMIPLGSCTMKLNATTEMIPLSDPLWGKIHPLVPSDQSLAYKELIFELEDILKDLTGFSGISFQPNAGSQGEYLGLSMIQKYHKSRGDLKRDICLIPESAHGTNPASAHLCGLEVKILSCNEKGHIDLDHLKELCEKYKDRLSCLMITYPSTYGFFEQNILEVTKIIHQYKGQVYLDGANMNALCALVKMTDIGADICHLNLHKTFCIPHGGGGPGVGPVGAKKHLLPFMPDPSQKDSLKVSQSFFGSASLLSISLSYLLMMGLKGLKKATQVAILNANYMAKRLKDKYPIMYSNENNLLAHECLISLEAFKPEVSPEDLAKRLMDYGFHAPTMNWPVLNSFMIEPTESEDKKQMDLFCDSLLKMHEEISEVKDKKYPSDNNVLKNSPHSTKLLMKDWNYPYSLKKAFFPMDGISKFYLEVGRVDGVYGDRNLQCSCLPLEEYK